MPELPVTTPPTARLIYAALEAKQRRDLHPRLSASKLDDCERAQWDAFRWAFPPEEFDGQKPSIFETGEVWEQRLGQRLLDAGVDFRPVDPATGEQFRVVFAGGHASGRTDGEALDLPEAPKTMHVVEFKSHNDKSFKDLLRKKVREAKPLHHAQMQVYMGQRGNARALYVAVNKNDDAVYVERVEFDPLEYARLMTRAERIVSADRRPACSCAPYLIKAGYGCAKTEGAMPSRSCRTCLHVSAHLDGDARWSCARWGRDLTEDEQRAGCERHLFNPDLIPGEQVDADEGGEWVRYELRTGEAWVDGGRG